MSKPPPAEATNASRSISPYRALVRAERATRFSASSRSDALSSSIARKEGF
jgi:hypothetical protein